jgi:hypothetical protein
MTVSAMPADQVWQIIERAAQSDHDPGAHVEALRVALRDLPREEVISFAAGFMRYLREAYSWDLWGAAYVVNGGCSDDGCSDDGFEYFCRWLVSRGREVYELALVNPGGLAQLEVRSGPDGAWEFEEISSVAQEVFKKKMAKVVCWTMPSRESDICQHLGLPASLSRKTTVSGLTLPESLAALRGGTAWLKFIEASQRSV